MTDKKPKILFWDLETLPNIAAVWGPWGQDIHPAFLIQEWSIICGTYKWQGDDGVSYVSIGDKPRKFKTNPYDDGYVVRELHKILSQADLIVAHNGDRFDRKKLNTRIIKYGLPPLPFIPSVDTLKVAKSEASFVYNKLDYIAEFLGVGQKLPTSAKLWRGVMDGDTESLDYMVKYGLQDVNVLEDVYNKLLPYMRSHPNLNLFVDEGGHSCPNCGSDDLQKRGFMRTRTSTFQRYQCKDCTSWSKSGKAVDRSDIR